MKKIVLFAGLLLTLTGCSIYHPQAVDIPLINHEGDTRVDASVALSYWIIPSTFTMNTTVSHGFNGWLAGQVHANFGGNNYYLQAAPVPISRWVRSLSLRAMWAWVTVARGTTMWRRLPSRQIRTTIRTAVLSCCRLCRAI